jgi:[acyl-carrier-protein] S-malonyltransferase
MASAAEAFGEALKGVMIKTPTITLYSNYTGAPYCGDFSELLRKQISNPVRWQEIITHMIARALTRLLNLARAQRFAA